MTDINISLIKKPQEILESYLKVIKENTEELLKGNYSNSILISNAISKGLTLCRGRVDKQTFIDICAIGLTVLVQMESSISN